RGRRAHRAQPGRPGGRARPRRPPRRALAARRQAARACLALHGAGAERPLEVRADRGRDRGRARHSPRAGRPRPRGRLRDGRPGGLLFLATPNRYSLGLEPHVRLWGVGFLPRRLAETYVETVRKASYSHVRLLSARTLAGLLERHGLEPEIVTPAVPTETQAL